MPISYVIKNYFLNKWVEISSSRPQDLRQLKLHNCLNLFVFFSTNSHVSTPPLHFLSPHICIFPPFRDVN